MPGLDHGPNPTAVADSPATSARNSRIGQRLFAVYLVLYGGFVLVSAMAPEWMEVRPWAGVNLAILYGFGLIGAAFVIALVYGWWCRAPVVVGDSTEAPRR